MNIILTKSKCSAVILMLLSLQRAWAYYDPGTQKWLNRDPIGEQGFEVITKEPRLSLLDGEPNRYVFVANSPLDRSDCLGLKDWGKLIDAAKEAAEEALKTATPGGEFAAAFKVFDGCNSLGLALAWAKTQRDNCLGDALLGDPKTEADREAACGKKWDAKIKLLQGTYDAKCRETCYSTRGSS